MTRCKGILLRLMVGTLVMGGLVSVAAGQDEPATKDTKSSEWMEGLHTQTPQQPVAEAAPEWEKPIPLTFKTDYTVVSDYIFRGVNFSEFRGEGRERLNHQATAVVEANLGDWGNVGGGAWFEWFAGQQNDAFDPNSDSNLQEVDYFVYWNHGVGETGLTFETGWIAYTFPQASGDAFYTNEWYMKLSYDDSKLFGTEKAVLNPYVAYYLDTDDVDGCWMETGISHGFALADLGMAETPILKNVTLTPSMVVGVDKGQFDDGCHLHNIVYGLDVGYDISGALGMPAKYGSLSLHPFVNFSQAINDDVINDEFWGGVKIAYQW